MVGHMRRALWLLAAVVLVLLGLGIYVATNRNGQLPIQVPVGKGCQARTDAGSVQLYPAQMANAATIAAVGVTSGIPDRGIVVALATAMQESELLNLDYGDRDSLGLFQQRPSQGWGSPDQVRDPRYASAAFYNKLLTVPGWQEMRVTEAAQAVQRSAFPEAYEKWAFDAQLLGEALIGVHATAITCAKVAEPTLRGAAAAEALAAGLRAEWGQLASTAAATGADSLAIRAGPDRAGWQLAHWLVANSVNHNVSRVTYGEHQWTVDSGEWMEVDTPSADTVPVVVADVYPV
jgi:hypothetical protein